MSGIVGVFNLDRRRVDPTGLDRMVDTLAHRGPDGSGVWRDGNIGLGHCMLHTTPEALHEVLPLRFAPERLTITADARIDNRDELFRELRPLLPSAASQTSDSELILHAYRKWGEHSPARLVGDYAFAIWDARRASLFCARDHFGVRPFYYRYEPHGLFAFASEIKALAAIAAEPPTLNEVRVGDFLQGLFHDKESTFFREFRRLPPAHTITISPTGFKMRQYWSLDPEREISYATDAEYAEAYREIFAEAVRSRLRSISPVGYALSGGLDSSSIVCTARRLGQETGGGSLRTFSLTFDELAQCDERKFMGAVVAQGGIDPQFIRADALSPMEDLDRFLWHQDEPSWIFNGCLDQAMYQAAKNAGVRVFLDGFVGDDTVNHALPQLAELFRQGRWLAVAVSAARLARAYDVPVARVIRKYAVYPAVPVQALRFWRRMRRQPVQHRAMFSDPLNPEFFDRIALGERIAQASRPKERAPRSVRGAHYLGLTTGLHVSALEASDRTAAAYPIDVRLPFVDRRLMEFCLALPADQKFYRGWTRMVARRAMEGILPETVRWREGKGDMLAQFTRNFLLMERERIEDVLYAKSQLLEPYLSVPALRDMYAAYAHHGRQAVATKLWKPVILGIWLSRMAFSSPGQTGKEELSCVLNRQDQPCGEEMLVEG